MHLGDTLDEALVEALTIGPLARAASELDEAARDRIRPAVRAELAKHETAYGIVLPAAVWLVSARI
jgi:hypothetical protein